MHGTKAHAETLRDQAADVLAPMGLRLSAAKTKICHIDEGVDFLGFCIQRQPKRGSGKLTVYTYPTKKAVHSVTGKVRAVTRTQPATGGPARPARADPAGLDQLLQTRRV